MYKIFTVCTANVCRSPTAEMLLKKELNKYKNLSIKSFGTDALFGKQIYEPMKPFLFQKGIEHFNEHRSKQLFLNDIKDADMILCMENYHVDWICQKTPLAKNKVKLFGHWEERTEVYDPVDNQNGVQFVFETLERMAMQWKPKIDLLGLHS